MIREIDINEISDGQRYTKDSMVKISCNDCDGCSKCCHDMGNSIILDPYDIFKLCDGLNTDINGLLCTNVELNVVDGIILPNIKMIGDKNPKCGYLNEEGKCSIHLIRPGFCRLFPLGRIYENDSFSYFNQIYECDYPSKSKVKVKKWLDIPNIAEYEKYILNWHDFIKSVQVMLTDKSDEEIKNINMKVLNIFFVTPYDMEKSFYEQYYERVRMFS